MSLAFRGATGFCVPVRQTGTSITSWGFIGQALQLKPPGKNTPTSPPVGGSVRGMARQLPDAPGRQLQIVRHSPRFVAHELSRHLPVGSVQPNVSGDAELYGGNPNLTNKEITENRENRKNY